MDARHHLVEPVLRLHQLARAAAPLGQAAQEPLIDGAVDPDGEDADPLEPRPQRLEDLVLVADLAIRDEHQDAIPIVFAGRVAAA